ncbi:MAG: alpha/beta hydrolase, partial [Gammaproteobacteria bacterium]|nr:alpha/beta hydrolase [Gammaproteobacteria bacterium]
MPTATVDTVQYYFRENGRSGPLVILGHSDASSSAQWRSLMEDLGGEFRLRAFDTAGQGRSHPWPEEQPYSIAAESRIVDALAESETARIHLVGHSAGGMFLLGAALRLGERLASLTLVEPVAFFLLRQAGKGVALAEVEQVRRDFKQRVRAGSHAEAMAGFVDYWTGEGNWAAMPEERRAPIVATAPKIYLQWDAALCDHHTLADFSQIS